jgi:hypothetical protein
LTNFIFSPSPYDPLQVVNNKPFTPTSPAYSPDSKKEEEPNRPGPTYEPEIIPEEEKGNGRYNLIFMIFRQE